VTDDESFNPKRVKRRIPLSNTVYIAFKVKENTSTGKDIIVI